MIIDCVSDLHGEYPVTAGGDVLIIAGDCTASDQVVQWGQFFSWLKEQNYRKKIVIAGNHDGFFFNGYPKTQEEADSLAEVRGFLVECGEDVDPEDFQYLCDSGCEFEGVKFWGSPWTPKFCNWHFQKSGSELEETWEKIPKDTNVLITHGPPFGILDYVKRKDEYCGDKHLRSRLLRRNTLPELKLHVFGHIHEHGGKVLDTTVMKFVNCSYLNEDYDPVNRVMRVIL